MLRSITITAFRFAMFGVVAALAWKEWGWPVAIGGGIFLALSVAILMSEDDE